MTSFVPSLIILGIVTGASIASVETVKAAATDGWFTLVQTNGMERRQDRRDTRQDCRAEGGLMGADKRNCKQEGRTNDDDKPADTAKPADSTTAQ